MNLSIIKIENFGQNNNLNKTRIDTNGLGTSTIRVHLLQGAEEGGLGGLEKGKERMRRGTGG